MNHEHPKLTEPEVRKHLCDIHDWQRIQTLMRLTYFQALVAHMKEHVPPGEYVDDEGIPTK